MNRLWVRISLVIIAVIIFGMLLPMMVGIATREFRYEDGNPPAVATGEGGQSSPDGHGARRERKLFPGWRVLDNLAPILAGATLVSIAAGVLLSRNLTAPLSKLADAARSIGQRDLSRRVEVRGTQEIRDVAQAFNEMADQLQQSEILRQNLLADVAHELRTPLTVIQGNLQAILDDVYALDKAEIARLYDQTRQLSRLVDDLRELAQAEARQLHLETEPLDFAALTAEIAAVYEPLANAAGIDLRARISEGLPSIVGDRARLAQCIQNLLNNAIQHTPAGGEITLTLERDAGALKLSIADTGEGIAPEHLPHIFDRFYRADSARSRENGGTGLGLAITRAIILAHGGEITAQSAGEGQGTAFVIQLPLLGER